jgi:BASS family bile acid:Na+ symporter
LLLKWNTHDAPERGEDTMVSPVTALGSAAEFAIFFFGVTSMLSVGLGLSLSQILEQFRSTRLTLSALAANFVVVPMLAYLITRVIPLDRPLAVGILLLGTGAGAPFLPKLAEFARGSLAFAVGLMVLLMAATIVYMPIVLPLLIPGAHIGPWAIAKPLVTVMLMPLTLSMLVKACEESLASRFEPSLRRMSTVALLLAITLVLGANYHNVIRMIGFNAILAGALLLLISFGCGFALGGPSADTRKILAFGTAQRDLSAALLVSVENFSDPAVVVMLIVIAVLGVCIQVPIALAFGGRATAHAHAR